MTRNSPDDDSKRGAATQTPARTADPPTSAPRLRLTGTFDADEVSLVRMAQQGDRAAFESLVRGTARMLYARLYLDTGDRERTEDLVQETYLVAWRSIHQLHDLPEASGFRRWLFSIARTVRIDAGRHESRKKRTTGRNAGQDQRDALSGLSDQSPSPLEESERRESHDRLLGLLRALPEEYRAPISMRYLAGADYATVCKQLGLSNGSLRGLLARGMSRLRQMMTASEE